MVLSAYTAAGDSALVSMFRQGEVYALNELIQRYKQKIFTTILYIVKDKQIAEDIFQETFIKVINTLRSDRYNEENKFLSWALRIAHNLSIDTYRKKQRVKVVATGDNVEVYENAGNINNAADVNIMQFQSGEILRKMLLKLPDDQREVLVLRFFGEFSFKEIAKITDTNINTALGRMRYGLMNLKKMMAENSIAV